MEGRLPSVRSGGHQGSLQRHRRSEPAVLSLHELDARVGNGHHSMQGRRRSRRRALHQRSAGDLRTVRVRMEARTICPADAQSRMDGRSHLFRRDRVPPGHGVRNGRSRVRSGRTRLRSSVFQCFGQIRPRASAQQQAHDGRRASVHVAGHEYRKPEAAGHPGQEGHPASCRSERHNSRRLFGRCRTVLRHRKPGTGRQARQCRILL